MRKISIIIIIFITSLLKAQSCESRYINKVFNSIQIFRDVKYSKDAPKIIASSLGAETVINKDLVMDIFMPAPTDTVADRPVIIIAHGGGFIDVAFMGGTLLVGTKDNDDVQALCDSLAHRGFVTACIEYRTGFDVASTTSIKRAVWRGAQDMSAAIRFFRKNAQWFNIDPEKIFIGGSSAGAFCAIHSCFVDFDERITESYQQGLFSADLGPLHSRPVVQLTGFNPFTGNNITANDVDSIPLGIVSYWGAIADTAMFNGNNSAPIRMFHGGSDPVVSSQCSQPFASVVLTAPVTCGSEIMEFALNNRNMSNKLTIAAGEGHEYWGALNGLWTSSGPNAYWMPIIDSTALFFYDLMRPEIPQIHGPSTCLQSEIYTFKIINPNPLSDYCWEVNGGTILTDPHADSIDVIFLNNNGQAEVKASERDKADILSFQSTKTVNISTVNNTRSNENNFIIYPNPTHGQIQLELKSIQNNCHVEIYDILGNLVYKKIINDLISSHQLENISSGNYIISIRFDNHNFFQKLTIK